jgi:hypothetical protein
MSKVLRDSVCTYLGQNIKKNICTPGAKKILWSPL